MNLVPRAYEGHWSQERVADLMRQLTMLAPLSQPEKSRKLWFKGSHHSTINQIAHSWTLQESYYLIDPYSNQPADPMDLGKYDPKDLIFVRKKEDVDLIDDLMIATAPVWQVDRRYNFADSALTEFDASHEYFAYHVQTVRTATFRIPEEFDIQILREDDESFKFVCRLHGYERTNKVYRLMMEMAQ